MAVTEAQIEKSFDLGVEYLSRLTRRIRRPNRVLQLPPETPFAVLHDGPGIPLTRIVPLNDGEVRAGPQSIGETGVSLPILKMKGDPTRDFALAVVGVPGNGDVTNQVTLGPTREGDTWTFEQTADYKFRVFSVDDSVWSVKYKSIWSATNSFPPRFQISVRKEHGRVLDGVLAWDNFAVVPESTQDYVVVVDQFGEQPLYRAPTAFHTTRYHKNIAMTMRSLALRAGNQLMRSTNPYLTNFWRQFSAVPDQETANVQKRIINYDLYDGLFGWGGDRDNLFVESLRPPQRAQQLDWLMLSQTFYDPKLYPRFFPPDVSRVPYQSRASSPIGNLVYRETVWRNSPQLRCHQALHVLWADANSESAWEILNRVAWDGHGIRSTADPNDLIQVGLTVDAYKGNWLSMWLCAVTVLESYLARDGDPNRHLSTVRQWADEAVTSVIRAQVPSDGRYTDLFVGSLCQPEHAGGIFNGYTTFTDVRHRVKLWPSALLGIAEAIGNELGVFDREPSEMPHHQNFPTAYEATSWAMIGLTYYLANRF